MSLFPACRLIVEAMPETGAVNMARDEALLDAATQGGLPTVRWYRWQRPALSLGYFQRDDEARPWIEQAGVEVVRRLTGGGAILHDREWTYSVTLPTLAPLLKHPYELYDVVHRAICRSLKDRFGLNLELRGTTLRVTDAPVLCYLREDEHDVCLAGVKIIGSAQRRRRGALLQHGSLLLRASPLTPSVRGLYDLAPETQGLLDAPGEWQADLARELALKVIVA